MKKSFRTWISEKIARTMLYIKATTYKKLTDEPYKWACGMLMRIYNDNRMMLANYMHRKRITSGFAFLLKEKEIDPDYIIGTSSSGIAPAASLAEYLGKELLINHNDEYYSFPKDLCLEQDIKKSADIIISTCPLAIPYGVQYANKLQIGFAYVRPQKKDHGKEQAVEGIIKPGMKFFFVYNDKTLEEIDEITNKLQEEFKIKLLGSMRLKYLHIQMIPAQLKGKKAVVIEDLFSTGGSSASEVFMAREAGMICNHCFSIFSYGFDYLKKQFSGETNIGNKEVKLSEPCDIDSLLEFPILLEIIKEGKFYPPEIIEAMRKEIGCFDKEFKSFLDDKERVLKNNISLVK